jgi:serine protease Do
VAAVGNAYGYEHTVTTGIISHLKRTVQINEDQIYENLIQTDASINPGNSGGPLLNVDGEMIGINVAVRVGAQGIAFAIPVNEAMEVAARLMAEVANARVDSGLMVTTQFVENEAQMRVAQVVAGSAADQAGIKIGDQIHSINGTFASRSLDWYRAIVEARVGTTLQVGIRNETGEKTVSLTLEGVQTMSLDAVAWSSLGMKFSVATDAEMSGRHPNYQRGLKVMAVRSGSPAEKEGIKAGDILVAMHGYKTENLDNLAYILEQPELKQNKQFMFYILRDKEPYFGQLRFAERK